MVCKTCSWRAEKFGVETNGKFVLGSTNYQLSSVKDHATTGPHAAATSSEEESDAKEAGMSVPPRKLVLKTPTDSAIFRSLQKMNDKDRETVTKLHDIAFYVALHNLPFTQFEQLINLEKLHNVPFSGAYENETACRNFILDTSDYLFEENMKKKLELVNFISILCDGSTDKSITEQEAIFVVFLDPVTNFPSLKFFEVAAPEKSQDAQGLHDAFIDLQTAWYGVDCEEVGVPCF